MENRLINEYIQNTVQGAIDMGLVELKQSTHFDESNDVRATIYIGKLCVYVYKGSCILNLGEVRREDGPAQYQKVWKNDVGGLFVKDVKRGNLNLYYDIFINGVTKCLVRKMTREEVDESIEADKPYSIVLFNKNTPNPEYYCIIKVIEADRSYSDEGKSWYSEIYNPEEDEELKKKLKKEDRMNAYEDENNEDGDDSIQFADLGLVDENASDYNYD